MGAVTTKLEGFKELERVLKRLPGRLAERELTSAARAGANVIRRAVIARAPESGESSEQRSKRSSSGKDYGPLKKVRVVRVRKARHSVEMGIKLAFWWAFLEFGTVNMAAKPFVGPAFDASRDAAVARLGKVLGKRLEKTARELAGPLGKISRSTRRRL